MSLVGPNPSWLPLLALTSPLPWHYMRICLSQCCGLDIQELVDDSIEEELIPWALVARREVVQNMKRYEVARQENIRELVYTERTHLHKLKIMKYVSPVYNTVRLQLMHTVSLMGVQYLESRCFT